MSGANQTNNTSAQDTAEDPSISKCARWLEEATTDNTDNESVATDVSSSLAPTETSEDSYATNEAVYRHIGIVSRRVWVAEPSREQPEYLPEPAKFVIILHSATEEPSNQAEAIESIRYIQSFHISSRGWSDIGYNFIISNEGLAYEGRGWCIKGAHSNFYNGVSVGICFLGCYLTKPPREVALLKAKEVINHGLEIGAIAEDYTLLAHCQCSGTESPGQALFEEIKKWDRWDGSISVDNPAPLIIERQRAKET